VNLSGRRDKSKLSPRAFSGTDVSASAVMVRRKEWEGSMGVQVNESVGAWETRGVGGTGEVPLQIDISSFLSVALQHRRPEFKCTQGADLLYYSQTWL
jgi:hypothetical protein